MRAHPILFGERKPEENRERILLKFVVFIAYLQARVNCSPEKGSKYDLEIFSFMGAEFIIDGDIGAAGFQATFSLLWSKMYIPKRAKKHLQIISVREEPGWIRLPPRALTADCASLHSMCAERHTNCFVKTDWTNRAAFVCLKATQRCTPPAASRPSYLRHN